MAKSSLIGKMLKAVGKDSKATVLKDSDWLEKPTLAKTPVWINNLMLSGSLQGGIMPGLTMVVGDSRTFKTNYCLMNVKAFLDSDPEAICLFFDSEFGAAAYFKTFGIDEERVIHIPIENLEELKFQMVQMLSEVAAEDKVMVFIDSVSQVASIKEVEDAQDGKSVADMTRAKQLNSIWRIVTPMFTLRKIPCYAINSFYSDTSNKYAEQIIKGGKQGFLSSERILFVTRSQEKGSDDKLAGWNFNYTIMKSRHVKEKSKFTITVRYDGGIDLNSGLFELAQECGIIFVKSQGWYNRNFKGYDPEEKTRKADLMEDTAFWEALVIDKTFNDFCHKKYALEEGQMFAEASIDEIIDLESGEVLKFQDE